MCTSLFDGGGKRCAERWHVGARDESHREWVKARTTLSEPLRQQPRGSVGVARIPAMESAGFIVCRDSLEVFVGTPHGPPRRPENALVGLCERLGEAAAFMRRSTGRAVRLSFPPMPEQVKGRRVNGGD